MRKLILMLSACLYIIGCAQDFDPVTQTYSFKSYDERYNIVDTSKYMVTYRHVSNDNVIRKRMTQTYVLLLGDRYSLYEGYGNLKYDSISNSRAGERYTADESIKLSRSLNEKYSEQITDLDKVNLRHTETIFGATYWYEEPIPKIEWQLEDGTEVILGYECHKATAKWRGREWTAWYSDIPYSLGPWKFNGLPGLILKLEDCEGIHKFLAVGMENRKIPIGYDKYEGFRTKRERLNAMVKDHCEHAGEMVIRSGMVKMTEEEAEKIRKRRLFYAPIELE